VPFPYNDLGVGTRQCRLLRDTSQDTAVPFPYNDLGVGTRQCRLLRDTSQDTAVPFPYNDLGVGTRQCRLLRDLQFLLFLWDGRPARPERTGGTPIPQICVNYLIRDPQKQLTAR